MEFRKISVLGFALVGMIGINQSVMADDDNDDDKNACPAGLFVRDAGGNLMTIDDEFGAGTNAITSCLKKRKKIKVIMQVNKSCRDTAVVPDGAGFKVKNHPTTCDPGRGYGIAQMKAMIRDWTISNGINPKRLDLNIIVHGGGGWLMMKDIPGHPAFANKFEQDVKDLMASGVKFYFCQNTMRGFIKRNYLPATNASARIIDGVEYVTGGLTSLADFQKRGYTYIQP